MASPRQGRAWLLIAAAILSACTVGPGPARQVVGEVKIGADLPLTGFDAPEGVPVRNAVELALKQAGPVCGTTSHQDACVAIRAVFQDDVNEGIHDAAKGAKNVELMAADPRLVGMVGPLYDSLARSELPLANAAHLAMISPAATDECLTQEPADGHCQGLAARLRPRGPNNFFRVVTTQLVEGAAGADLAFSTLGKKKAYVVNDATAFGSALARAFATQFGRDGGTVLNPVDLGSFNPDARVAFGGQVERARASGADVLYFAGSTVEAAADLRREMTTRLPQVPLLASDRLANSQFAKSAGSSAIGTYYTTVGPYPARTSGAKTLMADYRKAYGREVGRHSLPGFDATNILIAAISRAIDDAGGRVPTRDQVLNQVGKTRGFPGVMGQMSFDTGGDTSLKLVSVYQWLAPTEASGRFTATISVR
jgi:branched-chain amino acid transport system substrate-binding protein